MNLFLYKVSRIRVVLFVALMHLIQGITLVLDNSSIHTTAFSVLGKFNDSTLVGALLIIISLIALYGVAFVFDRLFQWLIPQQMLLGISTISAITAIYNGAFPDGTKRTRGFLLVDKIPIILIFIFHLWGVLTNTPPNKIQN